MDNKQSKNNSLVQHYAHIAWAKPYSTRNTAFLDSGASLHLLQEHAPAKQCIRQSPAKCVTIPNGTRMHTTETVKLELDTLPSQATVAHRLPGLSNNLVSAPILCDAGCTVTFSKDNVVVKKRRTTFIGRMARSSQLIVARTNNVKKYTHRNKQLLQHP